MTSGPSPTALRGSTLQTPLRIPAIVYLLTVLALRWGYPPSPRLVISAGPQAVFAGFTPDGKKILTNTNGVAWRLWDVRTGQMGPDMAAQFVGEPIGFSPDGKRFYAGAHYYSAETGEVLPGKRYVEPGWDASRSAVDTDSPDGLTIAHTPYQRTIVADANSGEERFQVLGGSAAAFNADSTILAVAIDLRVNRADEEIIGPARWAVKLYDPLTGNEQRTLAEDDGTVNRMAISPDGNQLALAVWQETPEQKSRMGIQIWNVTTGKREQTLPMQKDLMSNLGRMRFLAGGRVLAVEGGNFLGLGSFAWDLTVPMPDDLVSNPDYLIGKMEFALPFTVLSADGRLAAIWDDRTKELQVRRLGNEKTEIVSRRSYAKNVSISPLAFAADERLILAVYYNNTGSLLDKILPRRQPYCDVVDASNGRLVGTVPHHLAAPIAGVSPDGRTLVSHEMKHKLHDRFTLWDVPTPPPWLAIFGWALLPAVMIGMVLRTRQRPQH